jgi:hypothetical protein
MVRVCATSLSPALGDSFRSSNGFLSRVAPAFCSRPQGRDTVLMRSLPGRNRALAALQGKVSTQSPKNGSVKL